MPLCLRQTQTINLNIKLAFTMLLHATKPELPWLDSECKAPIWIQPQKISFLQMARNPFLSSSNHTLSIDTR